MGEGGKIDVYCICMMYIIYLHTYKYIYVYIYIYVQCIDTSENITFIRCTYTGKFFSFPMQMSNKCRLVMFILLIPTHVIIYVVNISEKKGRKKSP